MHHLEIMCIIWQFSKLIFREIWDGGSGGRSLPRVAWGFGGPQAPQLPEKIFRLILFHSPKSV